MKRSVPPRPGDAVGVFDEGTIAAEEVLVLDAVRTVPMLKGVAPLGWKGRPPGEGFGVDGLAVRTWWRIAGFGGILAPKSEGLDEAEERGRARGVVAAGIVSGARRAIAG